MTIKESEERIRRWARAKPRTKEPVLAVRCACPHFVPNWCCRGDVYFHRVTQLVEERQAERDREEIA